ncbi:SDH family Clp fold serine proteinase [Limibacillus halophilus]|uniref:ClpP class serine protease n=1 Tax=Limibacillus halophilus TaxID=1579333 RepID=A0A839SUW6_9PROT|nr:ATP-dependent Clp protease proteolytic subunit [Limibacillus halophilus]MBB3065236.1 ClpP class serine protease [Limibacillus halophilus]
MDGGFFWIVLLVIMLQPVLQQRVLMALRQRKISQLEKKRGSRVILLVHRQETMRLLGFPLVRYIDVEDSEQVLRAIHLTDPKMPIDLILQTPGGLVLAALQIARALQRHQGKVRVYVPHYAMSGGTLLALAADEIVMCHHSVLGPVDPQIAGKPAVSILNVVQSKSIDEVDDETLILADIAEKAVRQLRESVLDLLLGKMPPEQAEQLADTLTSGRWTHDYPITEAEARRLGLPIANDMPDEVFQLMELFPQPVRSRASVEYLPTPHERQPK